MVKALPRYPGSLTEKFSDMKKPLLTDCPINAISIKIMQ
jgi:hypothetical protein